MTQVARTPVGAAVRDAGVKTDARGMRTVLEQLDKVCFVLESEGRTGLSVDSVPQGWQVVAAIPDCPPDALGARALVTGRSLRAAYMAGAMAGGIASVAVVAEMRRHGLLASFGAGGLPVGTIERRLIELDREPSAAGYMVNLLHSPQNPRLEADVVDLLLRRRVRWIEASAFMGITPALARYRVAGLRMRDGRVVAENRVMAKVSRIELMQVFGRPVPDSILGNLVKSGLVTVEQAQWAREVSVADEITVEADSGGHTDSRPLAVLLPRFLAEREALRREFRPAGAIHLGAAGGLGTPTAVAAAFALGADYVVTGSINQVCREADMSDRAKVMLAAAGVADFAKAPAADMFEIGAQVQVLKKSTMFAARAQRLGHLYEHYGSLEALPTSDLVWLEEKILRRGIDAAWADVLEYLAVDKPDEVTSEVEPRRKMALLFRSYLGLSSRWARDGDVDRAVDYQLWAGPALGAFNEWVAGGPLAGASARSVVDVAANLMVGAAYETRVHQLRTMGVRLPPTMASFQPRLSCAQWNTSATR